MSKFTAASFAWIAFYYFLVQHLGAFVDTKEWTNLTKTPCYRKKAPLFQLLWFRLLAMISMQAESLSVTLITRDIQETDLCEPVHHHPLVHGESDTIRQSPLYLYVGEGETILCHSCDVDTNSGHSRHSRHSRCCIHLGHFMSSCPGYSLSMRVHCPA